MKRITVKQACMRIAVACLTALLTMQAFSATKSKTVEYPLTEMANTTALDIAKVELTKSATILHLDARFTPKYWIRIDAGSYLKADGKKYMLTGAEGIQPDSLFWMPESGEASFILRFEPMPMNTQAFDFIESDCEDCFKLYGVDLTGKKAYDKPGNLPESVVNVAVPDAVPAPVFECGKTTVRLHLLNYRPEYNISSVNMYVNTFLGKQEEHEVKIDPKSGEGELSFQQYGTALAFVVMARSSLGSVWLAPGESIDLYADLRTIRYKFNRYTRDRADGFKYVPFQPMYTNGTYAGLNHYINKVDDRPYYGFDLYTSEFADYRMTSAEYADHVINTYKSLTDSVNSNSRSQLDKEYQTLRLRQSACVAMAKDFREHNYRSVHRLWRGEIPADSIAPLKPEDAQRICGLFDVNDTKLLMGSGMLDFVNAVFSPNVDWMNIGGQRKGFLKDMHYVKDFHDKALNAKLSESDFAGLKAMDTPFFYNAFCQIQAEAKNVLASMEGKVETAPDVPVEQLFDAIIAPHKGKVILVDFWNTWCGPCRESIKYSEPLKQGELKNDNLVWIYIANESSPISTYLRMVPDIQGLHYRLNNEQWRYLTDKQFDIDGIPSYVVVDKSGHYSLRNDLRDHNLLKQTLQNALAE